MKVIHIAPTPFFANRGCHIRIRNEIDGLTQRGDTVILCTYGIGYDIPGIDTRRIASIPGYTQTKAGFSPYKFIADILLFFLVLKTAWNEKPDILHGHLHEGALLGWAVRMVLFWRKMPLLMDMQGSLSGELTAYGVFRNFPFILRGFFFLERGICSLPTAIVCSSANGLDFLMRRCGVSKEKGALLGDVVPDIFLQHHDATELRQQYAIPDDKHIVIYSGSLLEGKGIGYLLEAMVILLARRQDLFFILVGYPTEGAELFLKEAGLGEYCLVVGEVAYDDLASWLSMAQLAVDPKGEASGEASGKILHYMASGLGVVCFDTVNNRIALRDHAFYAEPGSVSDLAAMIERGLTNQERRLCYAEWGQKRARECYSIEAVARILGQYYEKLLLE